MLKRTCHYWSWCLALGASVRAGKRDGQRAMRGPELEISNATRADLSRVKPASAPVNRKLPIKDFEAASDRRNIYRKAFALIVLQQVYRWCVYNDGWIRVDETLP